jgi:ketosteroid isomerase-like protein
MSQQNVEIVREAVEAFNGGNFDAALERVHPDVEWQTPNVFPDAGTYRGPEGVREFFETWLDTFQGFRLHLEKCVPAGDQRVLAALRVSGEGAESGVWVESPTFFQLFEFRDGQVIRTRMFQTESEALEAAGMRE